MTKIVCDGCWGTIRDDQATCPHCGAAQPTGTATVRAGVFDEHGRFILRNPPGSPPSQRLTFLGILLMILGSLLFLLSFWL